MSQREELRLEDRGGGQRLEVSEHKKESDPCVSQTSVRLGGRLVALLE